MSERVRSGTSKGQQQQQAVRDKKRREDKVEEEAEEERWAKRARGKVNIIELMNVYPSPHEEELEGWATDDFTGKDLDIDKVNEARKEETTFPKVSRV